MRISRLFLLFLSPHFLCAVSPVINRYLPTVTTPELPVYMGTRPIVSVSLCAAHAAKTFNKDDVNDAFMHEFNGLLELSGPYNLQGLITAGKEVLPAGYITPFVREKTGGDAWANHEMYFAARSSLSAYGTQLGLHIPITKGFSLGAQLPFWHLEARQQYNYPIAQNSQTISLSDAEQVRRFRRYVHQDFGLKPGDWQQETLGDLTTYVQWAKSWDYVWLLRSATLGFRTAVSVPLGMSADTAYPSSIPVGNDGHWGIALSALPACELKEGMRLSVPTTLTINPPHTQVRRLATYTEPHVFSPLTGKVQVKPGLSLRVVPRLTVEHLIENMHFSIGYSWTHHWSDTWVDMRGDKTLPSYLERTGLPTAIPGLTAEQESRMLTNNIADKKRRTEWARSYVTFDVRYEMSEMFKKFKNAPQLRFSLDYCISGNRAARAHQISGQLSWQF